MIEELELDATLENLDRVNEFVEQLLEDSDYPPEEKIGLDVAIEEIFVNIADYAYAPHVGKVKITGEIERDQLSITLKFIDEGKPFNPLEKADPDLDLPIEERPIGGLGIFLVKDSVDEINYEYIDGKNVLTIRKKLLKE